LIFLLRLLCVFSQLSVLWGGGKKEIKAFEITLLSVYRFLPFVHDFFVLISISGFYFLSFFFSFFSPSFYSAFVLHYLPSPCFPLSALSRSEILGGCAAKELHPTICTPLMHSKQALASDVRR
jgi:hypothetical protein